MAKAPLSIKIASVLAFERKLATSDAIFFSGSWFEEEWRPVSLREKAVLGTMSHMQSGSVTESDAANPNPQYVDVATLPMLDDTLKVAFTLRVLGDLSKPSACNVPAYYNELQNIINGYVEKHGFSELARRYAINLANGRFLWRNRVGAEKIQVTVEGSEIWNFDAYDYSLRDFSLEDDSLNALAKNIEKGLCGEEYVLLKVEAKVKLGHGQEVFPSQELVTSYNESERSQNRKVKKSRILYHVDGIAGMHSQKIGNAIRTIDTWHSKVEQFGPIAAEPYGAITNRSVLCRPSTDKKDFYTLLNQWVTKGKVPEVEQQHFVMSVLIRGGVFGGKSEKDKT